MRWQPHKEMTEWDRHLPESGHPPGDWFNQGFNFGIKEEQFAFDTDDRVLELLRH